MTTAQLRDAAREAAERLEWQTAADLYQAALDAYPHVAGALADADRNRLAAAAQEMRSMESCQ